MSEYYTAKTNFYGNRTPSELIERHDGPLYVYNEEILRERCREMKRLLSYPNFKVNYSPKANSNLELLKIIKSEGLCADAMSPGEIHVLLAAGFSPNEIFYVGNNVSQSEMKYAADAGIMVSVDSVQQLADYGSINPGGRVSVRFNAGVGAGHHEKVVTAGKNTKFGITPEFIGEVKETAKRYDLKISGINQHIGSLFMDGKKYIAGVKPLLDIAGQFEDLDFIDLGGGFGIPYHKQDGEERLNLKMLGEELDTVLSKWALQYDKNVEFKIEPGRYISAECGVLLGTVHCVKKSFGNTYIGTDIGFNVLMRPVLYDSYHDIEVYKKGDAKGSSEQLNVTIVGNICESGDILAKGRFLPEIKKGDIIGVMDAGAYGYSMSSNYNNRLRPAEVLIEKGGDARLIRRRETFEDIIQTFKIN
ncbi:MAG TPA: diaminopimelate decarboxylase [Clostridia bacterium]